MPKVILFANNYWSSPFQVGSHFLAREFAADGWDVLYVSDPMGIPHYVRQLFKPQEKARFEETTVKAVAERIKAWVPSVALTCSANRLLDSPLVYRHWHRMGWPSVMGKIRSEGFGEPDVVFINSLQYAWAADAFPKAQSMLRIADWNPHMTGFAQTLVREQERLIERADVVFASSKAVIKEFFSGAGSRRVDYLPNGFSIAGLDAGAPAPAEYQPYAGRAKIAVYVGAIDKRFDFELVLACARNHPQTQFFCVGKDTIGCGAAALPDNLHFIGSRPYGQISGYLAHADVCLIPQSRGYAATDYFNPLKLYQYMALNRPVVSTWWKEIGEIDPPVFVAKDTSEFSRMLGAAVEQESVDRQAYADFLQGKAWSDVYGQVKKAFMAAKGHGRLQSKQPEPVVST